MATTFESTLPAGVPELMRVSEYARYLEVTKGHKVLQSDLPRSLQRDLSRFETAGTEVLTVMAACIRHAERLAIHLQCAERVIPITLFPLERLVHCPISIGALSHLPLDGLQVMHLETTHLHPPRERPHEASLSSSFHPLAPLLWLMAMRGPRDTLLPEISGVATYRLAPSIDLSPLVNCEFVSQAVQRLRKEKTTLRSLSEWPGFDRERACRLLNAIYLQSALIVSRSHPQALSDSWFGSLGQR